MKKDTSPYPLTSLIETEISSVEFVRDYIVLHFDGPSLTILNNPLLFVNGECVDHKSPEYNNLLISCVSSVVNNIYLIKEEFIKIFLSNEIIIMISIRPENRISAEVVIYFDKKEKIWEFW